MVGHRTKGVVGKNAPVVSYAASPSLFSLSLLSSFSLAVVSSGGYHAAAKGTTNDEGRRVAWYVLFVFFLLVVISAGRVVVNRRGRYRWMQRVTKWKEGAAGW